MSDYNTLRHGSSDFFTNVEDTSFETTNVDVWWLTSNFVARSTPILNFERETTLSSEFQSGATKGDAMSFDSTSGLFTFPQTGLWKISGNWTTYYSQSTYSLRQAQYFMKATKDNNSTSISFLNNTQNMEDNDMKLTGSYVTTFNCENTSTDKIFYQWYKLSNTSGNYVLGSSTLAYTTVTFEKIG